MHLWKQAYNKIVCIKNIFLIPLLKKYILHIIEILLEQVNIKALFSKFV